VSPDPFLDQDPLAPVSSRFPLGPPPEYWAETDDQPSTGGERPFSLRGVVPAPPSEVDPDTRFVYDPDRQMTFVYDRSGAAVPLAKHTRPGATPGKGTSATPDGQDPNNPPPEEMHPNDYQTD
jgi:putative ATP-grasp target RiPP